MAHPTRGRRTGTYEIEEILDIDHASLTIIYRHSAAYKVQSVRLEVENTQAAKQALSVRVK